MKVALIHDFLIRFGDQERVLLELKKVYPNAPIYTFFYDEKTVGQWFCKEDIRTSFLQSFPEFLKKRHKYLLPLFAVAPETFDLREYDLVISSSSIFGKGIITRPKTIHINYCHDPSSFLWDYNPDRLNRFGVFRRSVLNFIFSYLRVWDRSASRRVDFFIASSKSTAQKIKKYYRRDAEIIYPPCRFEEEFEPKQDPNKEYFLLVSRLVSKKNILSVVEAFNKLELPLVIVGDGKEKEDLAKIAKPNIEFLGWQPNNVLEDYYRSCFAFVFPAQDDLSISIADAMSWGKPVLAFRAGMAPEMVLPGMTGEMFDFAGAEVIADGVRRLRENYQNYSPIVIRKWAQKFSAERFRKEFERFVHLRQKGF